MTVSTVLIGLIPNLFSPRHCSVLLAVGQCHSIAEDKNRRGEKPIPGVYEEIKSTLFLCFYDLFITLLSIA